MAQRHWADFWRTFIQLITFSNVVDSTIDIPLADAIPRFKWMSAWSSTLIAAAIFGAHPHSLNTLFTWLSVPQTRNEWALGALSVLVSLVLIPVAYGFLRLYTLVHHVMIINIFKSRGQRLRLLNLIGTMLPLSVFISLGVAALRMAPLVSWLLFLASAIYILYLIFKGYNVIFHRQGLHGFLLWVGATLVTWFVLAIGLLAVAVTFAVLSFFVLVVLRLFSHR